MGQSAGAADICLLMASPMATGLFHGAIMESGDCQGVLSKDIRSSIRYNLISGTSESAGEQLANDLGIADGPEVLQRLRSIPPEEILKAWRQDRQVWFDAIVDGWMLLEKPGRIFGEGRQAHLPVLVRSNANEASVFGHNDVKTVDQYKEYLSRDSGKYADQEFQIRPAATDADASAQCLQLEDDSFAYGAYSMAHAMTRAGEEA